MIRMLRRRFIWGAMGAFSILLVLVIGGMIVASYMMLERDSERFLSMMLDNQERIYAARFPSNVWV